MFKTGAQMFLLVLLTGLFLVREAREWPCAMVDDGFGDGLSLVAPRFTQPQTAPVTLVAIDDSSVASHAWPWTPLDYSLFAQAVLPFKPEVTAIDQMLDWEHLNVDSAERQKLPQYEKILGDTLLQCPKLLLAAHLGWPDDPQEIPPLQEAPILRKVAGDLRAIPEWTVIERQPKEEFRLSATLGFTNVPFHREPIDTVPLVLRYRGEVVPSFVLQAVLMWAKLSPDDVSVKLGAQIDLGDKLHIPIDAAGAMRVNFGTPKTRIGFDELLLSAEQIAAKRKPQAPVDRLAGGIALLARTDSPSRLLSLALRKDGSEGELFAAAIATIQEQSFLRRAPWWLDLALIAVVAVAGLWIPRWRKGKVALGALGGLIIYVLGALAVLTTQHVWAPIVLPLGLALFVTLYRCATPNREAKAAAAPPVTPEPKEDAT
jgi:CHASE2 domain